jgi:hypothetical protein
MPVTAVSVVRNIVNDATKRMRNVINGVLDRDEPTEPLLTIYRSLKGLQKEIGDETPVKKTVKVSKITKGTGKKRGPKLGSKRVKITNTELTATTKIVSVKKALKVPSKSETPMVAKTRKIRLPKGNYTSVSGYEPYILTALMEAHPDARQFNEIQTRALELMKSAGVSKPADEEKTEAGLERYKSLTLALRRSLDNRGLIESKGRIVKLTDAGVELAQMTVNEVNKALVGA